MHLSLRQLRWLCCFGASLRRAADGSVQSAYYGSDRAVKPKQRTVQRRVVPRSAPGRLTTSRRSASRRDEVPFLRALGCPLQGHSGSNAHGSRAARRGVVGGWGGVCTSNIPWICRLCQFFRLAVRFVVRLFSSTLKFVDAVRVISSLSLTLGGTPPRRPAGCDASLAFGCWTTV